jgi:acyl-coenzyme A thioesterase PaaI-like protein
MNEAANRGNRSLPSFGIKITHVSPERVTAELVARDDPPPRLGIMQGGAIMALAGNLGGTATTANLKPGQSTTTIESKSNFFAAVPIGDVARRNARRCTEVVPPWSGRHVLRAATASSAHW